MLKKRLYAYLFMSVVCTGNLFAGFNFSNQSAKCLVSNSSKFKASNAISGWDGTLERKSQGAVQGANITFDEGIYKDIGSNYQLTGQASFNTNSLFEIPSGADVSVFVQSDVENDITLNGGTFSLDRGLRFKDDKNFQGSGTVALQGHSFSFGVQDLVLTHTIVWNYALDVNLSGRTDLTGQWSFNGNAKLQGHGNVLDLKNSGEIYVGSGTTLELTDIVVKGLTTNNGKFIFQDRTSEIRMSNVTIELDAAVTTTIGGIYVEGPTTIVTKNYDWTFQNSASLTVDGMSLWTDPASYEENGVEGKVKFGSGPQAQYLDLLNSGTIKMVQSVYDHDELVLANSNAILNTSSDLSVNNSNAIVTHDKEIENNSNAILNASSDLAVNNSNVIVTANGTTMIDYKNVHVVLHDGDTFTGFVQFDNGFTVSGSEVVYFNTQEPISGGIDLRTSGNLELNGDLHLSSNVTFSSGGIITGNGNTILLYGDLTIPQDSVISFSTDTIINGQGNEIILDRWAQLFVDTNVTLTLKNVKIRNTRNGPGFPPIRLAAQGSKLALDNVNICPLQDFYFLEGQMFIYNDVTFTGSKQFVYRSSQPSRILSQATWHFEPNTTFYYDTTSSYTDGLTQKAHTSIALPHQELIIMEDETSAFYLNQCTFQTSHSGLRLTKGQLFFDNRVQLKNDYAYTFSWLSNLGDGAKADQGSIANSVAWSRDGRYLAVCGDVSGSDKLNVYAWDGLTLTSLASEDPDHVGSSVSWSPNGRYLAVGGNPDAAGKEVCIYAWNGSSLVALATADQGESASEVAWSMDGRYLAVAGDEVLGNDAVTIYAWNGSTLTVTTSVDQGNEATSVSWSPDGTYLAVGGDEVLGNDAVTIYSWNGSNLTSLTTADQGSTARAVAWSPDGRYLAVGGSSDAAGKDVNVYEFDGSNLTQLSAEDQGGNARSVFWSPCGRYLAVGGASESSRGNTEVTIYDWDGSNLTLLATKDQGDVFTTAKAVKWSPDGNYCAVGGSTQDTKEVIVYKVNYQTHTHAPSYDTGIIFGDSANGAAYDIDIFLLAGATVDVRGTVFYDDV